uniref:Uncharacterized protein n=1 Tax=Rhizophora mucronata TaxID=61149 RepID=A0A2P2PKI6_RHIMU
MSDPKGCIMLYIELDSYTSYIAVSLILWFLHFFFSFYVPS